MADKIIKPRCPVCEKLVAEWVIEGEFTCPRCHVGFVVNAAYVSNSALSIISLDKLQK